MSNLDTIKIKTQHSRGSIVFLNILAEWGGNQQPSLGTATSLLHLHFCFETFLSTSLYSSANLLNIFYLSKLSTILCFGISSKHILRESTFELQWWATWWWYHVCSALILSSCRLHIRECSVTYTAALHF